MNKFIACSLALLLCHCLPSNARVSVNIGGTSDGSPVTSAKGPVGINKSVVTTAKGGSIATAIARSKFNAKKITHGNKVISKGTAGDSDFTHVDADSIFVGTATFRSDDGEPVENFTIDIGLSGKLRCKTPDPDIPQFFSLAQMATDVIVDDELLFSGGATQDGEGTFSAVGDIGTSDFTTGPNTASIKKSFPINLGTLSDGQKLAFFFAGYTLVSYGADVPITYCTADFFSTDTFAPAKNQPGKFTIEAATKTVDPGLTDDNVLFIESEDEDLLADIDLLKVIISVGAGVYDVSAGAIGDVDGDGVSDVVVTASSPSDQSALLSDLLNSSNNTLFVFGQTGDGEAFSGVLDLSSI